MHISPLFTKAVTAAALVAAVIAPAGYTALRYERGNDRYATCIAQNLGGKAGLFSITDLAGNKAATFPVYRTYGLEYVGLRQGVIANAQGAKDNLSLVLHPGKDDAFHGRWDFVRIAGKPVPAGTQGRGDPIPDASQSAVGVYAELCANSAWVRGPAPGR